LRYQFIWNYLSEAAMQDDHLAIAELAYRLWEARGRPEGAHEQIWLDAERQWKRDGNANSTSAPAIDKTLKDSFPARDPPAGRLPSPKIRPKLARR
jgi:Protein of unknown function (DUF2934)